jgi:predicted dienelactone hydrolase
MGWVRKILTLGVVAAVALGAAWERGVACGAEQPAPAQPSIPTTPATAPKTVAPSKEISKAEAGDAAWYKAKAGASPVKTFDEDWRDGARNRTVPVRVYYPYKEAAKGDGKKGEAEDAGVRHSLVVFSPGLGASRTDYSYFARHLASHGYVVIVLSHPGSDRAAALEWVRAHAGERIGGAPDKEDERPGGWVSTSVNDPESLRERPRDVSFVIDRALAHADLGKHLDAERIGVAGHSFGAYTAMAIGGMTVDLPETHGGVHQSFRDKRVKAVLPMSPEGPGAMGIKAGAWAAMGVPVFYLTGTRDYGVGQRSVAWRRAGYEGTRGVDCYLVTIADAGHLTFGSPARAGGKHGGAIEELIDSLGIAFFDGYVGNEAKAREFLKTYSMGKRAEGVAEFRPGEVAVEKK